MRKCPFTGCGAKVPDSMFACRKHWFSLSWEERTEIHAAYAEYMQDQIGVEELRRRQQAVLGKRGDAAKSDGKGA